jgi:hypothetical protein
MKPFANQRESQSADSATRDYDRCSSTDEKANIQRIGYLGLFVCLQFDSVDNDKSGTISPEELQV